MTFNVMLGNFVLAGLELLKSLPVSSIVDPASPGSSFAIHPRRGLIRVNGQFVQLPMPASKTTYQAPTTVLEFANPSSRALPTPTTTATFDAATLPSQSGTGVLVALNLLVILWLLSLLALSLTYKPVLLAVSIWLANLRRRVLKTSCVVAQSIVRVVLLAKSRLDPLVDMVSGVICGVQDVLDAAQAAVYWHVRSAVKYFIKSSRVLLPVGAVVALIDLVHTISVVCDITIPYADILLVVAACPAAAVSCIFIAVLAGVIKPVPSTLAPTVEHEADFLAGMRIQRNRFM